MKRTTRTSKRTPKAPIFAPSILAIDLGKYKSVACALDPQSGECQHRSFRGLAGKDAVAQTVGDEHGGAIRVLAHVPGVAAYRLARHGLRDYANLERAGS